MRTYIFTEVERRAIRLLLEGKIRSSDPRVAYIRSRVKSFETLARDVDLYLRLREAEATRPAEIALNAFSITYIS